MLKDVPVISADSPIRLRRKNEFFSVLRPWMAFGQEPGQFTHRRIPNRFLALGNVQVATIESLAHHDLSIFEINVPPLKTKNLANPKRTEQRNHDHEPNVIGQSQKEDKTALMNEYDLEPSELGLLALGVKSPGMGWLAMRTPTRNDCGFGFLAA
jgi:hypothetical protein